MLNDRPRVLVTGATGFIGTHLCQHLLAQGYKVCAVGRKKHSEINHPYFSYHYMEKMDGQTQWQHLLKGVQVVVHLAARVHQMQDRGMQALTLYQDVNVKATQQLAREAIKNEVTRFIYLSTVKVIGEKTIEMPLRAEDQPRPKDAYSLSKLQAEQILQEESRRSGMEWVIIRPPLVYGPGVMGNFRKLIQLSRKWFPLPFGAIHNRRSLVSVFNLCSFIECCLAHPHARGEVFLVSDNEDLSTAQLVRNLRRVQRKRGNLFPFPISLLKLFGALSGKRRQVNRLVDSLQVNIEKSTRLLGWQPPFSVEASLEALCQVEDSYKHQQPATLDREARA